MKNLEKAKYIQYLWSHYGTTLTNHIDYAVLSIIIAAFVSVFFAFLVFKLSHHTKMNAKQRVWTTRVSSAVVFVLLASLMVVGLYDYGNTAHVRLRYSPQMTEANENVNLDETRLGMHINQHREAVDSEFIHNISNSIKDHKTKGKQLPLAKKELKRYRKHYAINKQLVQTDQLDLHTHRYHNLGHPNLFKIMFNKY